VTELFAYRPTGALGQIAASEQIVSLIRRLLRREGTDARLVRIDGVRELFGARWAGLETDMRQRIGAALSRLVGPSGVWLPFDETTYLLLPPDGGKLPDAQTEQALETLQRELVGAAVRERLITLWAPQSEAANGWACAPLTKDAPPAPSSPPSFSAPLPAPSPPLPTPEFTVVSPSEIIDGDQTDEAALPPASHTVPEPVAPAPSPAPSPALAKPAASHQVVYADIELSFSPIWEVRANRVFTYLCEPQWLTPEGAFSHEDAVEHAFKSDRARLVVDLTVLHKTHEAFDDLLEHDRLSSIILPVHYQTLADPQYENRYAAECRQIVGLFHQYICFEIISLPNIIDPAEFAKVTASIRPYCRALFARVKPGSTQIERILTPDVHAFTVDLRDDTRQEHAIIADLKALQDQRPARGGLSCAHGLRTKSLSLAAICEGFDLIGSDAIAANLEGWPMDDYMVKPIDLYAQLLKG